MDIPSEVWSHILSYSNIGDLLSMEMVCKSFNNECKSNKSFWTTTACTIYYDLDKLDYTNDILLQIHDSIVFDPQTGQESQLCELPPFMFGNTCQKVVTSDNFWEFLNSKQEIPRDQCLNLGKLLKQFKKVESIVDEHGLVCNSEGESLPYLPFIILDNPSLGMIQTQLMINFGVRDWANAEILQFLAEHANGILDESLHEEDLEIAKNKIIAWSKINKIFGFKSTDRVDGLAIGYMDAGNPVIFNCGSKNGFIYGVMTCTVMT